MSDEYERYVAQREGAQIAASDDYFGARKSIDTAFNRKLVEEGFKRAYDIQESELTALRSQVAELERRNSALRDFADELQHQLDEAAKQSEDSYVGSVEQYDGEFAMKFADVYSDKVTTGAKLYAKPINLPALIEQAKAEEADRIGKLIHYPECWDTAAYPTLEDALTEINHCTVCENPEAHGYPKDWKQQREAIRARKP